MAETREKKEKADISVLTVTKMISGKDSHNGFSDIETHHIHVHNCWIPIGFALKNINGIDLVSTNHAGVSCSLSRQRGEVKVRQVLALGRYCFKAFCQDETLEIPRDFSTLLKVY